MNVLVDTSIWSLALRRQAENLSPAERSLVQHLRELVREERVFLPGIVRQEVLSGIRNPEQFEKIKMFFRPFPDEPLDIEDYEMAATAHNSCRAKGIVLSAVDALICTLALRNDLLIFTAGSDFERYSRVLPLKLYPHARAN
jgi:predicted nucleic acid-binding protein